MTYFHNINSLADLKKQYRALAIANHPDKGGDTATMQDINVEFGKLFKIWEHDTTATTTATGYENDYSGTSAKEYAEYVYREYRWCGSNYEGQHAPEIVEIIRLWLKETYPHYKFSVRRRDYSSIYVDLLKADFKPFKEESKCKSYTQVNHYHLDKDTDITDRAREVMENVISFVNSYNYDDSDSMTDYFNTNFYLHVGIGNDTNPYKLELPKLQTRKKDLIPQFKHPEGKAHKAIRQALSKEKFTLYNTKSSGQVMVLGKTHYWEDGSEHFYPLCYSSLKTAQKRIDKLMAAGVKCRLTGRNGGYLIFEGYTDETEIMLEQERQEWIHAKVAWDNKNVKQTVNAERA